ncbi:hypothetical protein BG842_14310 [Haladaptatus sp. W1]|nr:hypothetical protein BG842_14310 [Haladaptatus sp. W1]
MGSLVRRHALETAVETVRSIPVRAACVVRDERGDSGGASFRTRNDGSGYIPKQSGTMTAGSERCHTPSG